MQRKPYSREKRRIFISATASQKQRNRNVHDLVLDRFVFGAWNDK